MKHFNSIYLVGWLLAGSLLLSLASCDDENKPINGQDPKIEITAEGLLKAFPDKLLPADGVVELSKEVKRIGDGVFKQATTLKRINATEVVSVGAGAFEGCTALEAVSLPATTELKADAFKGCTNLKEVALGSNENEAPKVTGTPFEGTPEDKDLIIEHANAAWIVDFCKAHGFATINGKAFFDPSNPGHYEIPTYPNEDDTTPPAGFNVNGTTITGISDKSKIAEHVIIPNYIKEIGRNAFRNLNGIKKFTAKGVEKLDNSAFNNASDLIDIEMPHLKTINPRALALYYCWDLKCLNKIFSVETIGDEAFRGTENLEFIYLPNVKKLGEDVFFQCATLQKPGSMVYFGATPPEIGSLGIKVHTLVIPKGSRANYEDWEHTDMFGQILELGDPGTEKFEEYLHWTADIN